MRQEIKDELSAAGVNLENALSRMMNNEKLLEKLLVKFLADPNYEGIRQALADGRYDDAFHCAHTLKGVAGNMGMEKLMQADIPIVEKLRVGNHEGIEQDMEALSAAYEEITGIIRKI